METNNQDTALAANPLMAREISAIRTWEEWKEKWNTATSAEMLHSLLHFGFSIECKQCEQFEEENERIIFYLEIADGHGDERNFGDEDINTRHLKTDRLSNLPTRQLKQSLSEKAFSILCNKFFKNRGHDDCPTWAFIAVRPAVFEKLLWFFRWDDEKNKIIHNLYYPFSTPENEHNEEVAREFALGLCKFSYTFRYFGEYAGENDKKIQKMFLEVKPAIIRILLGLKKENILLRKDFYAGKTEITELKKICLAEELWDGTTFRTCKTMEEAYFFGSLTAAIAILLSIKEEQREYFEKIKELEQEKTRAERELSTLQSSQTK